jgi:hypothetical protein
VIAGAQDEATYDRLFALAAGDFRFVAELVIRDKEPWPWSDSVVTDARAAEIAAIREAFGEFRPDIAEVKAAVRGDSDDGGGGGGEQAPSAPATPAGPERLGTRRNTSSGTASHRSGLRRSRSPFSGQHAQGPATALSRPVGEALRKARSNSSMPPSMTSWRRHPGRSWTSSSVVWLSG